MFNVLYIFCVMNIVQRILSLNKHLKMSVNGGSDFDHDNVLLIIYKGQRDAYINHYELQFSYFRTYHVIDFYSVASSLNLEKLSDPRCYAIKFIFQFEHKYRDTH